jgi:hypothetical protein
MKLSPCARLAAGAFLALLLLGIGVPLASAQRAALDLRLAGSPGSVFVGQQVTYSGTVSNDGGAVPDAAFKDVLPGRVSFVSASASQGSCTTGSTVVCDLGALAGSASATVTITVTANDPGLIVDRGWVSSNPSDQWGDGAVAVTDVRRLLPPPRIPMPLTPTVTTGATTTTGVTTSRATTTTAATTTLVTTPPGTTTPGRTTTTGSTGTTTTGTSTTTGTTTTGTTTTGTTTTGTTTLPGTTPRPGTTTTPG